MDCTIKMGQNCIIGKKVRFGKNVTIGHNCVIEDGVSLGDSVYIESNCIIRSGVSIGEYSNVGANCILGEHWMEFYKNHEESSHPLVIGKNALIRSGSIIYAGSEIGSDFQTGHQVTIREKAKIGDHVSIGTLSDIQGNCKIGNYVRLHSNVHVGQLSQIDDFVWVFPYVVLTNDPTPPSENFVGVHIKSFAIVATGAILLPGIQVEMDSLIAAGAIVTKSVKQYAVVGGNPAKEISDVRKIKNKITGEAIYPWRYHFSRTMPWDGQDFNTWYASLDLEAQEYHSLDLLETEEI